MEPCRSLALLAGSLALTSVLVAMSTDFWFVAMGPNYSSHSGLWPKGDQHSVAGYIRVTQAFTILAALCGLVSAGFLVLSCIPSLSAPGRGPLLSSITAFTAALSMLVAMTVYTSERWSQPGNPQVQSWFGWSFDLGWVSVAFFLTTGSLSLAAHCQAPRPDYDTV
ncbi:protein NKG7 [Sturnira hondurensis]|uniref:protein NKG7 n=1 Tax=Sturnira hondurensis TaxID=192404 RepID=UPI00187926E0|nr:protein NKG7 [Sturnira hondurensis]